MSSRRVNVFCWRGRTSAMVVACMAALSIVAGCETTNVQSSDGRPLPPEPRPAPTTPANAKVNSIALQVGAKPTDTNGNGYPDLIRVEAYLFARPHPSPTYEDGAFRFRLFYRGQTDLPGAEPIAEWRFEAEALEECRRVTSLFGPGYQFGLSLLEAGGEEHALCGADLSCQFEPADGRPPVAASGVRSLQIGKRGAKPGRILGQ